MDTHIMLSTASRSGAASARAMGRSWICDQRHDRHLLRLRHALYEFIFNMAFQFKVLFIMLAGINILVFYTLVYRKVVA